MRSDGSNSTPKVLLEQIAVVGSGELHKFAEANLLLQFLPNPLCFNYCVNLFYISKITLIILYQIFFFLVIKPKNLTLQNYFHFTQTLLLGKNHNFVVDRQQVNSRVTLFLWKCPLCHDFLDQLRLYIRLTNTKFSSRIVNFTAPLQGLTFRFFFIPLKENTPNFKSMRPATWAVRCFSLRPSPPKRR